MRSKVLWMKGKEAYCRTEYLLLKARYEVHPVLVLRRSCFPEKVGVNQKDANQELCSHKK